MSLNWDIREVANNQELCYLPDGTDEKGEQLYRVNPVTEVIIFASMWTGINHIKDEETAERFYNRHKLVNFDRPNPAMLSTERDAENKPIWRDITLEEVKAHIGLRTNASSLTPTQIIANLKKRVKL